MKQILFNTEKVWAILDGRKIVDRRAVKPQPREIYHGCTLFEDDGDLIALVEAQNGRLEQTVSPYRPGDIESCAKIVEDHRTALSSSHGMTTNLLLSVKRQKHGTIEKLI